MLLNLNLKGIVSGKSRGVPGGPYILKQWFSNFLERYTLNDLCSVKDSSVELTEAPIQLYVRVTPAQGQISFSLSVRVHSKHQTNKNSKLYSQYQTYISNLPFYLHSL
jgi:hypothetical protein